MSKLQTIDEIDIQGKTLFTRGCVNFGVVEGKPESPVRYKVLKDIIIYAIEKEAKIILTGHYGRPRDDGIIRSIAPLADLIAQEGGIKVLLHDLHPEKWEDEISPKIDKLIKEFKKSDYNCLILPQTRVYRHEEDKEGEGRKALAAKWASFADVYCYEAMPDWQDHASTGGTIDAFIAANNPVCAGLSCANEFEILEQMVTQPKRPFVAVIAGTKLSTKIKSVINLYNKVDNLVLGGELLNAYLCAKYDVSVSGIKDEDIKSAKTLCKMDETSKKILLPNHVLISGEPDRTVNIDYINTTSLKKDQKLPYVLDVAPTLSDEIKTALANANQIFYNAVMGRADRDDTFRWGSVSLYEGVNRNTSALKFIGGGDTEKMLKELCPAIYGVAVKGENNYHLFYAGGTIVDALGYNSVYDMPLLKKLLKK